MKIEYKIRSAEKISEIEIDCGALKNFSLPAKNIALITDDTIGKLYGEELAKRLNASLFIFPHGEEHKNRQTKERLEDQMFAKGLGRDTVVIAMGGGVATDLGGYIAATYCRGVPLIMIPTSLLGMVDASIGGKTGLNIPQGKNMLGVIYQPQKVIIDPDILKSLPAHEFRNGIVEMIKHGMILDKAYFEFLEANHATIKDPQILKKAIHDSCKIKAGIVEKDEKESGPRTLLNFGHTIGHALESLTHYKISHGEAVAIGVLVESYISKELGFLSKESFDRARKIIASYGLPLKLPKRYSFNEMLEAMVLDKKSIKKKPRFVIMQDIGRHHPEYCLSIEDSILNQSIEWMNHDLCGH